MEFRLLSPAMEIYSNSKEDGDWVYERSTGLERDLCCDPAILNSLYSYGIG